MAKRVRVVTAGDKTPPQIVRSSDNPKVPKLTENEIKARRYATTTSMGFRSNLGNFNFRTADTLDSQSTNFYSPQLSTDFLEKPQNLRERRAFYRFFYNTNEIVRRAVDIHSTLPLSKLRLVPPKGKNKHQNEYVYKFFTDMCDEMKLFKSLIEIAFEYNLMGNCVPAKSLIRTFEKYKRAEDIKVNDLVYTHNNRWKPVIRTVSRKSDNLLKIITKGFGDLILTEEHPVEIIDKKSGKRSFIISGNLCVGDFIRILIPLEPCELTEESKSLIEREDFIRKGIFLENLPGSYIDGIDGSLGVEIQSIEKLKGDVVYNFEVEEDHTYQVAGFSTHNCFIFTEENDWKDDLLPNEAAKKVIESKQKSEYLKTKFGILDKDPLYKGWGKLLILPPDQVRVRKLPLTDDVAIEYLPDPETRKFLTSETPIDPQDPTKKIKHSVSKDLQEKIRQSGVIPLDTDPDTGSHVYHLARKKSQYEPLGTSMIDCCVNTLVLMDKLRQAQTSIASRHMTPMRIVWADGLNPDDTDNLREQVDMALVDPDFSIIANYEVHWEEMGSQGRLLDIEAENESSLNRLFAGMGVTREILTGEGTYTGSKISLEIMNTEYLLFREILQDYVENYLFKPIARKKGFIEYDDYGNEVLLYPRLSFTRLAIRDNEQFFDAAFQLYQKGSISVDLILDILNIDPDSTHQKIEKDLFTVKDPIFNEVMRNIYTNVAAPLVEKTDLVQKLADYLKLEVTEDMPLPEGGESRFSSDKKLSAQHRIKMAKVMKYFSENPKVLDSLLKGST